MRRFLFASTVLLASVAGCNAILGIDPPNVVEEDATLDTSAADTTIDGGSDVVTPIDDGAIADVASEDAFIPGNVLDNPSFELGGSCQSWSTNSASKDTLTDGGYVGAKSCLVCGEPNQSVYGIFQGVPVSKLTPNATYVLTAWIRLPETGPKSTSVYLSLIGNETKIFPTTAWAPYQKSLTYTPVDGGTTFGVSVLNRSTDQGCFVLDNMSLVAE